MSNIHPQTHAPPTCIHQTARHFAIRSRLMKNRLQRMRGIIELFFFSSLRGRTHTHNVALYTTHIYRTYMHHIKIGALRRAMKRARAPRPWNDMTVERRFSFSAAAFTRDDSSFPHRFLLSYCTVHSILLSRPTKVEDGHRHTRRYI